VNSLVNWLFSGLNEAFDPARATLSSLARGHASQGPRADLRPHKNVSGEVYTAYLRL
jgi:hypothetical protein